MTRWSRNGTEKSDGTGNFGVRDFSGVHELVYGGFTQTQGFAKLGHGEEPFAGQDVGEAFTEIGNGLCGHGARFFPSRPFLRWAV